jgi:hypothetical protein
MTLTIQPGLHLVMSSGQWFRNASAQLIANGTEQNPIIIEGDVAARGAFGGVVLASGTRSGTSLSHVQIRNGGEESIFQVGKGCLTVDNVAANSVSLANVSLITCEQACLTVLGQSDAFATFDAINANDADVGVRAELNALQGVDEAVFGTATNNVLLIAGQSIEATTTWASQPAPFIVQDGDLVVLGGTLTIPRGMTFAFEDDAQLRVDGGRLVVSATAALRTTFTSQSQRAGAWIGLHIVSGSGAAITGARVSNAGSTANVGTTGQGGIVVEDTGVTITDTVFANNDGADIRFDCNTNPTIVNSPGVVSPFDNICN